MNKLSCALLTEPTALANVMEEIINESITKSEEFESYLKAEMTDLVKNLVRMGSFLHVWVNYR